MRKHLVAGNWKMNGTLAQSLSLTSEICNQANKLSHLDVVLCPSAPYLTIVKKELRDEVSLGAQDVSAFQNGAYTGQYSASMLKDIGCQYVIIGHSERRALCHETNDVVARKMVTALDAGLTPIVCVGETKESYDSGETESVILSQLKPLLATRRLNEQVVLAYEPIWAIGTGLSATPLQAQNVHRFVREIIEKDNRKTAQSIRILYGGSVTPDNAKELFAQSDIDGGLIGGAALMAEKFIQICLSVTC